MLAEEGSAAATLDIRKQRGTVTRQTPARGVCARPCVVVGARTGQLRQPDERAPGFDDHAARERTVAELDEATLLGNGR